MTGSASCIVVCPQAPRICSRRLIRIWFERIALSRRPFVKTAPLGAIHPASYARCQAAKEFASSVHQRGGERVLRPSGAFKRDIALGSPSAASIARSGQRSCVGIDGPWVAWAIRIRPGSLSLCSYLWREQHWTGSLCSREAPVHRPPMRSSCSTLPSAKCCAPGHAGRAGADALRYLLRFGW